MVNYIHRSMSQLQIIRYCHRSRPGKKLRTWSRVCFEKDEALYMCVVHMWECQCSENKWTFVNPFASVVTQGKWVRPRREGTERRLHVLLFIFLQFNIFTMRLYDVKSYKIPIYRLCWPTKIAIFCGLTKMHKITRVHILISHADSLM